MKISIVTAVYNRQGTIGEAIRSVQAQNYRNVEHLIQDGGSTDGTLEIVESLANSLTYVVSVRDAGIYDALNRGIARASGDVIGVMHSDDLFASDNILGKVALAFEDNKIDGVYGDLQYVSASDPNQLIRYWRSGPYEPRLLGRGWMPPHPTLYLRRSVFERLGCYDTSYQIAADYDAILRWLNFGKISLCYIPEVMVKMRVGGESNRSIERVIRKSLEDYSAIRRNGVGGLGVLIQKNTSKLKQFLVPHDIIPQ
ncbi:glycosyltransferase [Mesorhizobium sp. M1088]|uniref:glycosyltransferase family 2 protein n=1 Tax=Mesorhizobium sp. M1088 TaxID=2957056 RepID=UPI00333CC5D8